MSISGDNPTSRPNLRRVPTRAEATTLLGMTLAIGSLFLTWERAELPKLPSYYTNPMKSGFQMGVHWPLTVCAVICGLSLLWTPTEKSRLPVFFTQTLCGVICLLIPLRQFLQAGFSTLPGIVVALAGGALLLFGVLDRFFGPSQGKSD